jgi:hypothetical protein
MLEVVCGHDLTGRLHELSDVLDALPALLDQEVRVGSRLL